VASDPWCIRTVSGTSQSIHKQGHGDPLGLPRRDRGGHRAAAGAEPAGRAVASLRGAVAATARVPACSTCWTGYWESRARVCRSTASGCCPAGRSIKAPSTTRCTTRPAAD
jgi:hypothetical protein